MFKNFIPDIYVNSISDINLKKLKSIGIAAIILDLDNTLDSHETETPSKCALDFLEKLRSNNFSICVISNGKYSRVKTYLKGLDIPYVADAGKPLKKSYRKALDVLSLKPENVTFVGDQIFTDIWGANRMKLTTVLVNPIEQYENPFFYIKRALERFVKTKITKE